MRSLEEYHAAAAGAHRGHAPITLALPPGGHLPPPQEVAGGDTAAATGREQA